MSNNYIFPLERPLTGGTFDLCDGPGGRWAAYVASAGIRYGRWKGQVMDDSFGAPNPLFTSGERPSKLSICFDSLSNLIIAIQKDATNIEVRAVAAGDISVTTSITADTTAITADSTIDTADMTSVTQTINISDLTFAGLSPVCCFNGKGVVDATQSDVLIYYLKADGLTIFARSQREAFGTEHQINGGLPAALAALTKADVLQIGGTWFLCLWAITQDGRQVFLRSRMYPVIVEDAISIDGAFESGSYFVPSSTPTLTEGLTVDGALTSGTYNPNAIVPKLTPGDALTVDTGLIGGSYGDMSIPKLTPGDLMIVNATLGHGSYA